MRRKLLVEYQTELECPNCYATMRYTGSTWVCPDCDCELDSYGTQLLIPDSFADRFKERRIKKQKEEGYEI